MGNCQQKPKQMAMTYAQVPSEGQGLMIKFYGSHRFATESLFIGLEHPLSCEQVCMLSARHLSSKLGKYFSIEGEKTIGPLLLPMFGLYAADHLSQRWVPDAHIFNSGSGPQEFYFRIRVQPARKNIPKGIFADYLFWQCADDFLTGRLWKLFGVEIQINTVDGINKNALCILMASANYRLHKEVDSEPSKVLDKPLNKLTSMENIQGKATFMKLGRHLPKNLPAKLRSEYNLRDPIMRILSRNFMHGYIHNFYDKWGSQNLKDIRAFFVETLLTQYVPYYALEYFSAEKLANEGLPAPPVELVIRPYQDGCVPTLCFNKKPVALLRDILSAHVVESESMHSNQKCLIQFSFKSSPPLNLHLPNRESAESFLSVLECYCRLQVSYYWSLGPQMTAPSLQVLLGLGSFGPIGDEDARSHLRCMRNTDGCVEPGEACYIIYQDLLEFDYLHALCMGGENPVLVTYDVRYTRPNTESGLIFHVKVDNETLTFRDPQELKFYLSNTLGLGTHIYPKDEEPCGAMQFLKVKSMHEYCYPSTVMDMEGGSMRQAHDQGNRPLLYRDDQVATLGSCINQGEFSDVYRIRQMELGREAILKKVTSKNPAVQEAYRRGAEHLMKLRDCSSIFLPVFGLTITSPVRIIFKTMPEGRGSLLQRLRGKDGPPLNLLQLGSVLKQLSSCLCDLQISKTGLLYGNLCCAKILIYKEEATGLTIRLGDPSVALYCDTLPISNILNQKRLAWVAPERFQKLSQHTIKSEVYAFGTVIWEMLHHGMDPLIPEGVSAQAFFERGNKLPDPVFTKMTSTQGDVNQAVVAGDGNQHTQQWVATQDFDRARPNREVEAYMGVTTDSACESNLASGETCVTDLSTAGGQERQTLHSLVHEIQQSLLELMHACWHRNADQRPKPMELLKSANSVLTLADRAKEADGIWHLSILLEAIQPMCDPKHFTELQELRNKAEALRASQPHDDAEQQVMDNLKQQLYTNYALHFIDSSLLKFPGKVLGKGNYGEVVVGELFEACETRQAQTEAEHAGGLVVAVKKMIKQSRDQTIQFLKEAQNVCELDHPNVVKLKGIVMADERNPIYQLVMEFADMGTLEKYIQDNCGLLGVPSFKQILQGVAVGIANGMEYICNEKKMVHGDLAARNVLLFSADGTGHPRAKLSDFGLSHRLTRGNKGVYYYDIKKSAQDHVPVHWMPKEVIEDFHTEELKLTKKTDVWSYGVVLWEMFSGLKVERAQLEEMLSKRNTSGIRQLQNGELIAALKHWYDQGGRLSKPINCPPRVYKIMLQCWDEVPESRPEFSELSHLIEVLTENELE